MAGINDKSASYEVSDAQSGASDSRPILAEGIGRRISEAAEVLGTRSSAYAVMGVSSAALQRYIKGDNMPPFDAVARLCIAAGVRMEWIATEQGAMRVSSSETASDSASQAVQREALTMALQLSAEALGDKVLPPAKHAELVSIVYDCLVEGLPEAKVLRIARVAAV